MTELEPEFGTGSFCGFDCVRSSQLAQRQSLKSSEAQVMHNSTADGASRLGFCKAESAMLAP